MESWFRACACGFAGRGWLTLAWQSETLRPLGRFGWCDDADQVGGIMGRSCRRFGAAWGRDERADRAAGRAGGAGAARRAPDAAPGSAAYPATRLSELRTGARRRLSQVFSRRQRGARMQRDLCAGIQAERHGDRAAHELFLASRLVPFLRDF